MVPLTGGSQNRPLSRAIDSVVCYVLACHLTLTTASSGVDEASRGDEEVETGYVVGNEEMQPITNPIRKCNNVLDNNAFSGLRATRPVQEMKAVNFFWYKHTFLKWTVSLGEKIQ